MPRRKASSFIPKTENSNVEGLRKEIIDQEIVDTLETNYMPYAMSVIVSRAIPEIDGFKPAHRKLLYTMYKMNLLNGSRTKSANIVGQTMRLNPHGDSAIYDTMVRLSKGHDALLTPFVDSKGNFGKCYSRDMSYAASRYTEAKLSDFSAEIFRDIDKDTIDFVDNYDGTLKEPSLLPTVFPNILVSSNTGIAVGMASQICGFNLNEVCETAINLIRNPKHDILKTLLAPDFTTGGELIYHEDEIRSIYDSGRGSFKVRARWRYVKEYNVIEIYEIPYSTTVEAIIDKIAELLKSGSIREISDTRDETDLNGLKITIDLKRGVDPDNLMNKLFKLTPLMDSYSCNFNILVHGVPKVLSIREILNEWTQWRINSICRRISFDLQKKQEKLHLLEGLKKILLDIDRAVAIIRGTKSESDVVPNLMRSFDIDKIQAEYVADIKLRNINQEYILHRVNDIESLRSEIDELNATLGDEKKVKDIIINELKQINKKYPTPRRTGIVSVKDAYSLDEPEVIEDYKVKLFLTHEGYFKKIPLTSLGLVSEHKFKDGDKLKTTIDSTNSQEILFFTNKQKVYIRRLYDFENSKASVLGTYLPSYLEMDQDESIIEMILPEDYTSNLLFFFKNGKCAKIPLSVYATKNKRKKLTGAYSGISTLQQIVKITADSDIIVQTRNGRALIFNSALVSKKTSRTSQGVQIISLKQNDSLFTAYDCLDNVLKNKSRYRSKNIPATGAILRPEDELVSRGDRI